VERLFDRVKSEQNGQLDLLVNNAYSALLVGFKILSWIACTTFKKKRYMYDMADFHSFGSKPVLNIN